MKKILLVEDDVFIREIYSRELKNGGYDVTVAEDGEKGARLATSEKFDLILLDIMLPKKTGLEVLKDLRKSPQKDLPVYLLTNLGQGSVIKEAVGVGLQGYLLKARFLPSEVLKAVDSFFANGPMKINNQELGLE